MIKIVITIQQHGDMAQIRIQQDGDEIEPIELEAGHAVTKVLREVLATLIIEAGSRPPLDRPH